MPCCPPQIDPGAYGLTFAATWESLESKSEPVGISDANLEFAQAMRLPVMEVDGKVVLKRLTMVVSDGVVEQVFYPVFPPDAAAATVTEWLRKQQA